MAADPLEFQPLTSLRIVVQIQNEGKVIVRCQGHLVRETADEFSQTVKPLLVAGRHVVLDLREVRAIDSSGLGAMIALEGSASERRVGRIELRALSAPVENLLRSTNTLSAFNWADQEFAHSVLESRREKIGDELRRNPDTKFRETD